MACPQLAAPSLHPPAPRKGADGSPLAEFVTWDEKVTGPGLRNRFGRESWIVQTRIDGRSVRRVLGVGSSLTRETARLAASAVLDALHTEYAQPGVRRDATVAQFSERWLAECSKQWKPATRISHRHGVRTHILTGLGRRPVAALASDDVPGGLPL